MIAPVVSLTDLFSRALRDERYAKLAIYAAKTLGGTPTDLSEARAWLEASAQAAFDEPGVVDEINACRELLKEGQ